MRLQEHQAGHGVSKLRTRLIGLWLCVLMAACVQTAPISGGVTAGLTGKRPVPFASPGQRLPIDPSRRIVFDTSEGSPLSLDVSPDGHRIVYDLLGDIYDLPYSGGVARRLSSGMAIDSQPVFSPDGTTILFLSDRSGAENLWLMDAGGSHPRQISFYDDNPSFTSPEWSPDGDRILVSRFWPDRNAYELWQFRPVPGDMGEVLRSNASDHPGQDGSLNTLGARFSEDGQIYAASLSGDPSFDEVSAWDIARLDPKTGTASPSLSGLSTAGSAQARFRPALAPDGRTLVFAERQGASAMLRAVDLVSGRVRDVSPLDPDSLLAALTSDAVPRYDFSADGREIVVNRAGGLYRVPLSGGDAAQIPFRARVDQRLAPLARRQSDMEQGVVRARLIQWTDMSPNGKSLAFSALGRLYVQSTDRNEPAVPLRPGGVRGFHPDWSPGNSSIAWASWTNAEGGFVWVSSADGAQSRKVTEAEAFYTHPVFTPDGTALIVVRSPAEVRRKTYMEFGQLRDAELVYLPLNGEAPRVLAKGRIGGRPHFLGGGSDVLFNSDLGVEAVSLSGGTQALVTQAVGPGWYFAQGSAPADDIRVSPDGNWALAQIAHQLHLYAIDRPAAGPVDLSARSDKHVQLTKSGADYFGWNGDRIFWTVGSSVRQIALGDVVFEDGAADRTASRLAVSVIAARDTPTGRLLLRNATVVPMTDEAAPEAMIAGMDILIEANRIARIEPAGRMGELPGVRVVDLAGAYVIPGLIDAHYHVADIRRDVLDFEPFGLRVSLAYGVTTLFDPSSLSIDMLAYEDLVDTGDVAGSRLFTTGPAIFDYYDFRSKADVEAVLRRYKDDYRLTNIKQYRSGNRRVRQWVSEVARELGLTATTEGALSYKLALSQILDGFSGVEHAVPPVAQYKDFRELYARSGTSSTLTLMITHGGVPADTRFIALDDPMQDSKYAAFVPDWFRRMRFEGRPAHPLSDYTYPVIAANGAAIRAAGGTVGLGAHGDIPGLGTHWEMQAYAEGGWTPAETLWAATMGSAITIGRDTSLGSLEPGKLADLVILDANPLSDIRNTLSIRYVMKNGRLYEDDSLSEVER